MAPAHARYSLMPLAGPVLDLPKPLSQPANNRHDFKPAKDGSATVVRCGRYGCARLS